MHHWGDLPHSFRYCCARQVRSRCATFQLIFTFRFFLHHQQKARHVVVIVVVVARRHGCQQLLIEVAAFKICLLLIYDSRRHEALGVAVDDGCWRQRNPVPHPRAVRACLRPPLAAVLMRVRVWQASASQQTSGDPSLPPPCRCKPRCPPAARVTAMLRSHRTRSPLAVPAHFKGLDTPAPRSPASPGTRTPPAWHGSHRGVRAWRVHQLRHSVPTTPCRSQAEQASSLMYH